MKPIRLEVAIGFWDLALDNSKGGIKLELGKVVENNPRRIVLGEMVPSDGFTSIIIRSVNRSRNLDTPLREVGTLGGFMRDEFKGHRIWGYENN